MNLEMKSANQKQSQDMLGRTETVTLAKARLLLQQHLPPRTTRTEVVALENCLGRICADNIISPENLPPYPRSTMDGYAVRAAETFGASEKLPAYLEISGEVLMGDFPKQGPKPGSCFAIATGGILPPGTDAVVMLEHTVAVDNTMIEVVKPVAVGANVISIGEDVAQNEILLPAGHLMRPQEIGLLAGLGLEEITVFDKVRVGIIATGDELVSFNQQPPPGKIRDMNSISLAAQVRSLQAQPTFYGIAADNEKNLTELMQRAIQENDVILMSGSSSVGTRDLGEKVIEKLSGSGIIFHGVSIKPGKPVIMARTDSSMVFGLPGHPVSAAIAFELFVRPTIRYLSGLADDGLPRHKTVKARLMRNLNSASGRTDFVRVQIKISPDHEPEAHPILGKSGALSTMVKASGFIEIAEKMQGLKEGEPVEVTLFD
jgi:molybdopterin molybdotransferase